MDSFRRLLNPVALSLQKMELELTCPICLKLFNVPTLLPCNHISCSLCVTSTTKYGYDCPTCKSRFQYQELRPATHIEAIISIYKSVNSTISSIFTLQEPQVEIPDTKMPSGGSPESDNANAVNKFEEEQSSGEKVLASDRNDLESGPITSSTLVKASPKRGSEFVVDQIRQDDPREFKRQKYMDTVNAEKSKDGNKGEQGSTSNMVICQFCLSSLITEVSGPMLHYLHGEPVTDEQASQVNVLHVHEKCVEWAPQVFFVGETAKNLEPELARASKIKCSSCGLKGAALGCYAKSCRRSFHIPCASEIKGCRWDTENFLVLCPVHSSYKLPCDRSKAKEKIKANCSISSCNLSLGDLTSTLSKQRDELWKGSPALTGEWMICGSALSVKDKEILGEFVKISGVAVTNCWKLNVTHVIAATDERGACSRTLKVLMAILAGKWILSTNWLKACIEARHPVPEESFEISHDVHGTFDGPRNGRLRAMQKEPNLFAGLFFYFCHDQFTPSYLNHLEDLIYAAGGHFMESTRHGEASFFVYSTEPPEGSEQNDLNEMIRKRKEQAEFVAASNASRAVPHTWLLDSIAACSLQPVT